MRKIILFLIIDIFLIGILNLSFSVEIPNGEVILQEADQKLVSIQLNKHNVALGIGQSTTLVSEVHGRFKNIEYKSSNSDIVSVDANGKIVGKKIGTATITATVNGASDTCKVTVVKTHKINVSAIIDIGYYFDGYNSVNGENIYNTIVVNNSRKIYIKTTVAKFLNDFWAMTRYTNTGEMFGVEIPYTEAKALEDEGGKYLILNAEYFDIVKEVISNKQDKYARDRVVYRDTIVKALKNMNLTCSDRKMVEQIND